MYIEGNEISCDENMCCFGIELGPHPWYPSAPIGGDFVVTNNLIRGAGVGINSDASGYSDHVVQLIHNSISDTRDTFTCGALCSLERPGSSINISPDSVAACSDDNSPTSSISYVCT